MLDAGAQEEMTHRFDLHMQLWLLADCFRRLLLHRLHALQLAVDERRTDVLSRTSLRALPKP